LTHVEQHSAGTIAFWEHMAFLQRYSGYVAAKLGRSATIRNIRKVALPVPGSARAQTMRAPPLTRATTARRLSGQRGWVSTWCLHGRVPVGCGQAPWGVPGRQPVGCEQACLPHMCDRTYDYQLRRLMISPLIYRTRFL